MADSLVAARSHRCVGNRHLAGHAFRGAEPADHSDPALPRNRPPDLSQSFRPLLPDPAARPHRRLHPRLADRLL